jgi:hypothetical protein
MCKVMPVIPVDKVVDPKRIIGKKWRAKEEERHKGSLTQKNFDPRGEVVPQGELCPLGVKLSPGG